MSGVEPPPGPSRAKRAVGGLRSCLLIVVGIPVAIGIGYIGVTSRGSGEGELYLLAPEATSLSVKVDSRSVPPIPSGRLLVVDIGQGDHRVTIKRNDTGETARHDVKLDPGVDRLFVPPPGPFCLVRLDVTDTYYSRSKERNGLPPLPAIEERLSPTAPLALAGVSAFTEESLPDTLPEPEVAHLYWEIPCGMMSSPDATIVQDHLGYVGYEG